MGTEKSKVLSVTVVNHALGHVETMTFDSVVDAANFVDMCINVETIRVMVCGAESTELRTNEDKTVIDLVVTNEKGGEATYFSAYVAVPSHYSKEDKAECA